MKDVMVYIKGHRDVGASEHSSWDLYADVTGLEIRDFDENTVVSLEDINRMLEEHVDLVALLGRARNILEESRHEEHVALASEIQALFDRR